MNKKLFIFFLILVFSFACASTPKYSARLQKNYKIMMTQANNLAKVLCKYSEMSSCFWRSLLGEDINKLPHEAITILERIEQIVKGKKPEELTDCEKGEILGLWLRFSSLVGEEVVSRLPKDIAKFVALF